MTGRRLDAGVAVAAVGAVLILVSLFLDWYGDPVNETAWRVFEVLDLVLAAIALWIIASFLRRVGVDGRLPDAPLLLLGAVALAIVFSQLVNDPPRVAGSDASVAEGAWLALAGSALVLAGAIMSVARISFSVEHREPRAAPPPETETETVKLDASSDPPA